MHHTTQLLFSYIISPCIGEYEVTVAQLKPASLCRCECVHIPTQRRCNGSLLWLQSIRQIEDQLLSQSERDRETDLSLLLCTFDPVNVHDCVITHTLRVC